VVQPASYREDWLIEALAAYTALLWLEQDGKAGPRQIRLMLDKHRSALLQKTDDETAESAGPPVLGYRLASSKNPHGVEVIVYLKGPWILHMLRQLMREPKTGSDAAFFKFLRALRDESTNQALTTAGFRAIAERYVVPEVNAEKGRSLEWFFDQWIYGVGIPEVKVSAKVEAPRAAIPGKKAAPRASPGKVTGTAVLEGVDESWLLPIPIYVQTPRGDVFAGVAVGEAGTPREQTRFSLPLPAPSQKALPDPLQTLLAIWK
jgi:aminopeptidase N